MKWGFIQPLTGGFYLGAANVIGKDADFILSFPGFSDVTYDAENNIKTASNEYHLLQYLKSHDRNVPYVTINRPAFDISMSTDVKLSEDVDFSDVDLVCALPVCSGLSMVTSGTDETKALKNCNMQWIAKYTLDVIKPKVYCFENAPTFMTSRGEMLRQWFEELAIRNGYSIIYYKTDSQYHYNVQRRPRSFVIFYKQEFGKIEFDLVNDKLSIHDFFESIPDNLTLQEEQEIDPINKLVLDYICYAVGEDWFKQFKCPMKYILKNNLHNDLLTYCKFKPGYEKLHKYVNHILYKYSLGLNYYAQDVVYPGEKYSAISFRSMSAILHENGKRLLTIRECLEAMGMPHDFELYAPISSRNQIGQNVPVKTAEFIINQICTNILCKDLDKNASLYISYQNNTKHK